MQGCGEEEKFAFNFHQEAPSDVIRGGDGAEEVIGNPAAIDGEELGDEFYEEGEFIPFEPAEEVQLSNATVRHVLCCLSFRQPDSTLISFVGQGH